jgi:hypothetical protein
MEYKDDENIDDYFGNNERTFLNDTCKNGRFVLSVGMKESGKTFCMMAYLKYVLYYNVYKSIHCVLPQFGKEQNDSYDFLKTQKHVLIYKHYNESISKLVDKDREKGRTLFIIDDATGELVKNIDQKLIDLITTTRHAEGLTVWICVHALAKVLDTIMRFNIEYLFLYKVGSAVLLKAIYDEYFSLIFLRLRDFKRYHRQSTRIQYNCLSFNALKSVVDNTVKDWQFVQFDGFELKPTINTRKMKTKKHETENKKPSIKILRKINLSDIFNAYRRRNKK